MIPKIFECKDCGKEITLDDKHLCKQPDVSEAFHRHTVEALEVTVRLQNKKINNLTKENAELKAELMTARHEGEYSE